MTALRCSCQVCGEHCGELAVFGREDTLAEFSTPFSHELGHVPHSSVKTGPFISITGFIGHITERDRGAQMGEITNAMVACDLEKLHGIDHYLVPFYCSKCRCCYCFKHWSACPSFDPDGGSYEYTRGTCPQGHTRLLDG